MNNLTEHAKTILRAIADGKQMNTKLAIHGNPLELHLFWRNFNFQY